MFNRAEYTPEAIDPELLGAAHITVNKNAIPNDPEKPFVTSGVRPGSPATKRFPVYG